VTAYLRQVTTAVQGLTDAELLRRYIDQHDADAFAVLVHRHGPMVFGVCRRALGFSPDAEDAFQATFLALARSARKIDECLPGWLYRVAVRVSRKALRRTTHPGDERADTRDPFADAEWRDVRRVLDQELDRLPAKWRTPLVLCYLEGLSRDEAAVQMNCSVRTLHRNLADGRDRLREHLVRRGLAPAGLAAAVLVADGLKAGVPARLLEKTITFADHRTTVPAAVQALLVNSSAMRGIFMKSVLCGLLLAGAIVVSIDHRQQVVACPRSPRASLPPHVVVFEPLQKEKPSEDPLAEKVLEAQKKGIAYLKGQQNDGKWDNDTLNLLQPGGSSALALLALLDSGVKFDDECVARGLKHLRDVKPQHTYVVGLQTQVFCKSNEKADAELIKRNVEWLEKAAAWKDGILVGWSYQVNAGGRADNSNTRYAIAGLYAAHKAGFKVKKDGFWNDVLSLYIRTQKPDGGWGYMPEVTKPTHTMTLSGLICMTYANEIVGKEDKATAAAMKAAREWIATNFGIVSSPHTLYNVDLIAALGRASEQRFIGKNDKKRDWYKEGAEWLIKNQKPGGEWQIKGSAIDDFPIVSTSFALRFLASRQD
jgi:RNA polymerase sigma factor (sigma-70 family)